MRQKITAFLMLAALMISSFGVRAAESAENNENGYYEYNALCGMGLLADELCDAEPDSKVSRNLFSGGICRILGIDLKNGIEKLPFIDINAQTPYKNAVAYLYKTGIISGSESEFQPDKPIILAEAVKISLGLLGYNDYAQRIYGAYPSGQMAMAKRLKLTAGVGTNAYEELSAKAAVKLLYNFAVTCMVEEKSYSSDGTVSYDTDESRYPLSVYRDIFFGEDIMKSNGIVSISGGKTTEKEVVIGDYPYKTGDFDCTELIRQKVKFFYSSENGINKILFAEPGKENGFLNLSASVLATDDAKYSLENIVYWSGERKLSASISKYADFVYNNNISNDCTLDMISPKSGYIKLIDNNNDGIYEVVCITEFKNMFLSAVSAEREFMIGKHGDSCLLDDYENVKVFIEGEEADFSEVASMRIASLVESPDKKYLYIYVGGDGKTELLKSETEKGGENYYTFESGVYRVSESLKKLRERGEYPLPDIRAGAEYTYYLDMAGDVAAIEEANGEKLQYVYLLDGAANDRSFADENSAKFKIVLKDGTVTVAETADKIKIDETANRTGKDLLLRAKDGGSEVKRQIVKMTFNTKGLITEAEFSSPVAESSEYGYDENKFTLDYEAGNAYYMSGNCSLMAYKYCINGNTVCFARFEDTEGRIDYGVIPFNQLKNSEYYKIKVYDCDKYFEAAAIEIDVKKYINRIDGHILVDEVGSSLYRDGKIYKHISGYNFGKYVKYYAEEDEVVPEDLKRGDVIRISVFNNKVSKVDIICHLSENPSAFIKGGAGDEFCQVFGPLYSNNGRMIVTVNPDGSSYGKLLPTSAWGTSAMFVPVYDYKRDKITLSSVNSAQQIYGQKGDGSMVINDDSVKVFIYRRYNYVKELIVAYY